MSIKVQSFTAEVSFDPKRFDNGPLIIPLRHVEHWTKDGEEKTRYVFIDAKVWGDAPDVNKGDKVKVDGFLESYKKDKESPMRHSINATSVEVVEVGALAAPADDNSDDDEEIPF